MNIYYLNDTWPWMGKYTGYGRLIHYVDKLGFDTEVIETRYDLLSRMAGRIYSISQGNWRRRDSVFASAEMAFIKKIKDTAGLYHVLYYDTHYFLWQKRQKTPRNVIATIHHPPGRKYPAGMEDNLKNMSSAIILNSRDTGFYEEKVGRGRVKFIPHGVDTEFFRPIRQEQAEDRHLLFTGHNGRNTLRLRRVVDILSKAYPDLRFDLLVNKDKKDVEGLRQLSGHPAVTWHHNISDEELRELYQKSYLLLQPMESCSANNAIVEAVACGLPIVTTDVGGIRDYGGGSVYPVVANNDDDAMIALVERYMADEGWRNDTASRCRDFAEKNLAWPIIAKKHIEAYRELMSDRGF